ncbi:hypothetical protein GCM10023221_06320 [Luteimicrobium xylanilyticum]|uniref:DUF349 domain-containing protein n=1 Tax=Luteimicrobium xylanilyticum TaxID=1133546 RepID=A0A5P9QBD6_9MICO|nr:DUF349 domain-containing protein [Luteimicrobium xylanilyticum]QFU98382.1 uncharacterized protein KDY119_01894 [Luteimicrobium xylanilyticum]
MSETPPSTPPAPRPTPRPVPRPAPRPAPPAGSAAPAPAPTTHDVAPIPVPDDAKAVAEASTFGRVDGEGNVYVREATGERVVGQFPGVPDEQALSLYVRRYLDLQAKVALFEARLTQTDLSVREIDTTLAHLTEDLAEPAAVGDLDTLRTRLESARGIAQEHRARIETERAAAKEDALQARTQIVERAEALAATDPARVQWKSAGEELRSLLDAWKKAQHDGPRLDRPTEDALWKRFSHARTAFDRARRHFFAELEQRNAGARAAKEAIVVEAEQLAGSTDWGGTAAQYRDLMARWKAAGRANRKDDDALWARFRAAQDTFFHARDEANAVVDAEYAANLEVKEQILTEAETLVPVTDLARAKAALRDIQDRWETAGKVPRADVQRVEGRLRAVENAVRAAEDAEWSRSNPETRARAEGALSQLETAIAGLEADLAAAQASGDARKASELESALDARRSWLEQVSRAAEDARG